MIEIKESKVNLSIQILFRDLFCLVEESVLGEKLQVLMKIVGREVQNFVTRNCPMDISDVSTIDLERNLFGTGRGFSEFNK
jgi:hypothetical protein